jgi:hypothetical protein
MQEAVAVVLQIVFQVRQEDLVVETLLQQVVLVLEMVVMHLVQVLQELLLLVNLHKQIKVLVVVVEMDQEL